MTVCWSIALFGCAMLQWWLITQVWQASRTAMMTAGGLACWYLGAWGASLLPGTSRRQRRWWVSCGLLPLLAALGVGLDQVQSGQIFHLLFAWFPLVGIAGFTTTVWLSPRSRWPAVMEGSRQASSLMAPLCGVTLAWLVPWRIVFLVGSLCLLPLALLDRWPQSRCPFPDSRPRPVRTDLAQQQWTINQGPFSMREELAFLSQHHLISTSILASGSTILLNGTIGAILVPFATTHALPTLVSLIAGQGMACLIGAVLWRCHRSSIGPPDRPLPARLESTARAVALTALMVGAFALLLLSLPGFLQTPQALTVSITAYTLGIAIWGRLLPRLRPSFAAVLRPSHALRPWTTLPSEAAFAAWYTLDEQGRRHRLQAEMIATAILLPLLGAGIDRWSVESILVAGSFLLLVLLTCTGSQWLHFRPEARDQRQTQRETVWER